MKNETFSEALKKAISQSLMTREEFIAGAIKALDRSLAKLDGIGRKAGPEGPDD